MTTLLGLALAFAAAGGDTTRVRIDTDAGSIIAEIHGDEAPITAANFLYYVDAGLYEGGSFYRTVRADNQPNDSVRIGVIQGAANRARREKFLQAIPLERTNTTGLPHLDGTLSMARAGPDTATQEFFICVGDQPELDFGGRRNPDGQGFAVFGRVVEGMDVVRAIQAANADGQRLTPPIRITNISRIPPSP